MKSNKSISGITLIEILIGIVISMIMMGAMFTSYTVVNNSYSQVSDKAKISQSARNLVGMIIKDIRMAGFKYFNDTIKETDELIPIRITKALKGDFGKKCDQIEIVYGDVYFNAAKTPQYTYERFKITYFCEQSQLVDKAKSTANKVSYINALAVYKKKRKVSTKKKATIISRVVKFQNSLKPEFNFKINFNLEKYIQAFFDIFANKIIEYKVLKTDEKRKRKLEEIEKKEKEKIQAYKQKIKEEEFQTKLKEKNLK